MGTITGRNCRVEVALTFAAAVLPTAVTKANPAVATLNAHGLADAAVGFWSVSAGMVELDEQAVMLDNPLTNTFEMPGLDTTDYSVYTAGSLTLAASWGTVSEAAAYNVGGGGAKALDDTRLHMTKDRNVAGNLASQDVTIDVKNAEIDGAAMAFIEAKAKRGLPVLMRISKGSQVLRVFYGVPSIPGEAVAAGQLATGQFNITVPAWVVKPNV
jgi:hypothetical protein